MKSLLVPLDGSLLAEKALDAVDKILPQDGTVALLTITRIPNMYFATEAPLPVAYNAVDITRVIQEEMQAARDYQETVAKPLREKGYRVVGVVETGDPATVIADQARYYDAVMMTTHGRTGLGRLLYGSVTQNVIGMSPRPVIVIPNAHEEADLPATTTQEETASS